MALESFVEEDPSAMGVLASLPWFLALDFSVAVVFSEDWVDVVRLSALPDPAPVLLATASSGSLGAKLRSLGGDEESAMIPSSAGSRNSGGSCREKDQNSQNRSPGASLITITHH